MSRDYIRIAFGVVVVLILGLFMVPLTRLVPLPFLKGLFFSPIYSMVLYLVLKSTNSKYTTLIFGFVLGVILTMFMPYIFFIAMISAVLASIFQSSAEGQARVFGGSQFVWMLIILRGALDVVTYTLVLLIGTTISFSLASYGVILAKRIEPRIKKGGIYQ